MTTLVIGGTGHTGARVASRLGSDARIATRKTGFDWNDPSTHERALAGITGVYLIAPPATPDPAPIMNAFLERALAAGVRRYVLLSSSAVPSDGPGLGEVERLLRARAPEWAVLKPSWFMQNFVDPAHFHAQTAKEEGAIYTSTGDGRVGFVDADDIGDVAAAVLAAENAPNDALVITGPEALSYDDVAALLGVRHVNVDDAEAKRRLVERGIPETYASLLVSLDSGIRDGAEDRVTDTVERFAAHAPTRFADFVSARARPANAR